MQYCIFHQVALFASRLHSERCFDSACLAVIATSHKPCEWFDSNSLTNIEKRCTALGCRGYPLRPAHNQAFLSLLTPESGSVAVMNDVSTGLLHG